MSRIIYRELHMHVVRFAASALAVACLSASARGGMILAPYSASNVTSNATFFSTPPEYTAVNNPAPYGAANNTADLGWILESNGFTVDFGTPKAVQALRIWSSLNGTSSADSRGANWNIDYSSDNTNWTNATLFNYATGTALGWTALNADGSFAGSPAAGTSGWYGVNFNGSATEARYWRVQFVETTITHSPRSAEVLFYAVPEPASLGLTATGGLAALGWIMLRRRKRHAVRAEEKNDRTVNAVVASVERVVIGF
jgi:hypothetical protein